MQVLSKVNDCTQQPVWVLVGQAVRQGCQFLPSRVAARVAETGFCQYFCRNGRNTKYDIFKICSLLMNAIDCCLQSHTCSQCTVITRPVN